MSIDLPLIWAGIIGFAIFMYVLLDGFDLGIGILFPWIGDPNHRDMMVNSIAPLWDGNETWMVFGAAALYGAFPLAYSTLLPVLYMPIMIMLIALIFRGVAFEFRFKAHRSRFIWDMAFSGGSIVAAFCQGLILGTFVLGYHIYGLPVVTGHYVWFSRFSVMSGIGVVAGYALLGSTWLIMKTNGDLQKIVYQTGKVLMIIVIIFIGVVSIWTPLADPAIMKRWFNFPNFYYLLPLPILTILVILYGIYALYQKHEKTPFIMSMLLFVFSYIGFVISSWPYMIPRTVTIWQAASPRISLIFLLVGAIILLPILIAYSIYAYYVFRGKVKAHEGYHE